MYEWTLPLQESISVRNRTYCRAKLHLFDNEFSRRHVRINVPLSGTCPVELPPNTTFVYIKCAGFQAPGQNETVDSAIIIS